ncbi:MAG: hypothetical protein H6735_01360 [Alphaproteobacteria bacterium]|nr:hypothetical protein [Alphaproteobacteria bacterium]
MSKIVYAEGQVLARANGDVMQFATPWMLLYGGSSLVTGLDVRAAEANAGLRVGWRTADILGERPNAWQTLGTQRTANNEYLESFDVSAETSSLLVQAAVFAGLTTGTTPKGAFARLWAAQKDGGMVVARQRVELLPSSTTVSIPIGAPFSAVGVTGLMAAIVFYGVQGTIVSPSFVWRPYTIGDNRFPGTWSTITTGSNITGDGLLNTSGAITTTSALMAQAGFQYSTSGSTPNGVADVIIAAKTS